MADHDPDFEQVAQEDALGEGACCADVAQATDASVQDLNALAPADRAAYLAQLARAQQTLGDVDEAIAAWHRVLCAAPNHLAALRALAELHRDDSLLDTRGSETRREGLADAVAALLDGAARLLDDEERRTLCLELADLLTPQGEWQRIAELRLDALELTTDTAVRRVLYVSIASTLARELDDAEQAIDLLLIALRESLDDDAIARELDALARSENAWARLVAAARGWTDEAELLSDTTKQVLVLRHLARWYAALGQRVWAIDCLDQARGLRPWDVSGYLALATALEAEGRRADARAVLEEALHRAVEKPDRKEVAITLGALLSTDDADVAAAAKHLRVALEIDGDDLRALRALFVIYPKIRAWAPLLEVSESLLARIDEDDADRAGVLRTIAEMKETHFLDFDGAARRWEEALEIDAHDDASYAAVARCYTKLRLWDAAVYAHERHVDATTDDGKRVEAYVAMGRICEVELGVAERAIEAYRAALEIDPMHPRALEALARVYDKRGEARRAIEVMRRLADATTDVAQKIALLVRVAVDCEEKLLDREAAREAHHAAIDADPTCVVALATLRRIATEEESWEEVATLLDREQRHTPAPRARAKLLVELARVRGERLDDARGAMHAYEEAHALDPDREDAALAVVGALFDRRELTQAEPILARLARTAGKRDRIERARIFSMHGRALEELGKPKRALQAYLKALEAVPNEVDARRGLAECAWILGDFPAALAAHQKLLATIVDEDDPLRAKTLYRIGAIHRALGDARKAISYLQRAIEIDERHRPALQALVELHTLRGAHRDAIDALRRMADVEDEVDARCGCLVEIANRWRDRLSEPARALEALGEAVDLRPRDRTLLHRLLQEQEGAGEWEGVCATIDRIVALDDDGARIAKYLCTAATVRRDRLDDVRGAIDLFERALDADARQLSAFAAIDEAWTRSRDWPSLEAAYRRMLSRCGGSDPVLEHALWHALGCLLRDRSGDQAGSVEAFRFAARLRPDDSQQRRILAQAYQASDRTDLALAELQQALDRDPNHVPTLRALYDLCTRAGMLDRAWCIAAALVFCDGADAEQKGAFEELKAKGLPPFRQRLDDATWTRFLVHPMQHADVDALLVGIAHAARKLRLDALRARGSLPPPATMTREDPTTTQLLPSRIYFGLARVLGVDSPELYVRRDAVAPIGLGPAAAFSSVVAPSHLGGRSLGELAFVVGAHLVHHRREHLARATFPALSELASVVQSAMSMGRGEDDAFARAMRVAMSQDDVVAVCQAVRRMGDAAPDVQRWVHGAELTALRLGATLSGDLFAAAKIVRQQQVVPGTPTTSERVRELVRWFAGADHTEVRAALGIAHRMRPGDDDDEPTLDRRLCA